MLFYTISWLNFLYIFKSNLFYQWPKNYFWKHLPLTSILFRGQSDIFTSLFDQKIVNLTFETLYVHWHFCLIQHTFLTGLPIFQLLVPPYVIWKSVSSKIGNSKMDTSGNRMLTSSTVSILSGGFIIHSRLLWNMVNK